MLPKDIKMFMERHKEDLETFERYDRTREFDLDKVRRSFTLRRDTYNQLKEASRATGKPMSQIIEKLVKGRLKTTI